MRGQPRMESRLQLNQSTSLPLGNNLHASMMKVYIDVAREAVETTDPIELAWVDRTRPSYSRTVYNESTPVHITAPKLKFWRHAFYLHLMRTFMSLSVYC